MQPRSSTLFHFTKSEDILFDILLSGFWPRYCLEDVKWHSTDHEFIAFPMVCFCDIPLARISDHVDFYGSFGVGLTRDWAEKNNLNPILYLSSGSKLTESVVKNFQYILKNSENDKSALNDARYIVAYSKPTQGQMIMQGVPVEKEFYQESEWRYVPVHENVKSFFFEETLLNTEHMESEHQKTKEHSSLNFLPSDVTYIFVPKDSDIPNVINFMQNKLDHYPNADLKVLYSRVFSLESLHRDL